MSPKAGLKSDSVANRLPVADLFGVSLVRAIEAQQPKVTQSKRLVSLFQRNYRAELEALYAEKNRLHSEIQLKKAEKSSEYECLHELYEEKKELHKKRQRLQNEIDCWYAEAKRHRMLLGKKDREIPKYSLFGISQNSLESAKSDREVVFKELNKVKEGIDEANWTIRALDEALEKIRTSLDLNKQRIIDTKKERAEFFDLKKSGETIQTLKTEWDDLSRELTRLYNLTIVLEEERAYFIRDAEDSYGVPALRTELDKQLETRVTHLRAYDLPEQQLQRRQQHREQWLAKHP
ncbi:hypothetical protein FQZ97_502080 [compost metagenome]